MSDETPWEEPSATRRHAPSASLGSVEVIKADIERTQAELAETLEALQYKLHPKRLIGSARGAAKGYAARWTQAMVDAAVRGTAVGTVYAERAGRRVREEVRARPTSAVLLGSGLASLAWFWLTRRPGRRRGPIG